MARAEYYIVGHDKTAYRELKSKGEDPKSVLKLRLTEQIPSYMGEFVLDVNFKEFYYEEKTNPQTGRKELHAPGFTGEISGSYDNAIRDVKSRGWSGAREEAECEGFKKLEEQLFNSPEGTFYLWISPPGSKEEGYGEYSFTHFGQIHKTSSGRRIEVTSMRNKLTLEEHVRIINHFLPKDKKLNNPKDTDFLRNPVIIENRNNQSVVGLLRTIDAVRAQSDGRQSNFTKAYGERKEWERGLRDALQPLIEDYYLALEGNASPEELQRRLWAMENYTRELMAEDITLSVTEGPILREELEAAVVYQRYGYQPKELAGGGCPSGDSNSSESPFSSSAILPWQEHKLENSSSSEGKKTLECTCPNCQEKVKAVIENGKIHCPSCGASAPYKC